jgi:hypothetical protein
MSRLLFAFTVLAFAPALAAAQDKKPDPLADVLAKLRKPVDLHPGEAIRLTELADFLTEKHGLAVTMNTESFNNQVGDAPANITVNLPKPKTIPAGAMLRQVLADRSLTYLVRKTHIEIVPISTVPKELKVFAEDDGEPRLATLVSTVYKEKPLNEALADLAEENDLTVVVAPQAADNKAAFVSARMMNVPADKAIELLALQGDLRVVKKGNTWFVTSKEHAAELFNEGLDKKKQKKEVELLGLPPGLGGGRFGGGM